jgi:transcriptional regulator with XRE-family HTH domain
MTKGELSKIIHVSITEIGSIERNQTTNPGYYLLEAIGDFFGISAEALVRDDLSLIGSNELCINRALSNLPELSSIDMRSALVVCDDLNRLLSEKSYFDYRLRRNKSD